MHFFVVATMSCQLMPWMQNLNHFSGDWVLFHAGD